MLPHLDDTIAALASAPGPGARGIVRLSGRDVCDILQSAIPNIDWPAQRLAERRPAVFPIPDWPAGIPIHVYFWPTRRSFTGQPLAEFHLPGSPPLLDAVLERVCACGSRLAQPGEFTLRAFLAGRLDLTQAEAVLGVIDAGTSEELRAALNQLAGGLSTRISRLRGGLLDLLADLEAGLDFAHEDLEFVPHAELVRRLDDAQQRVRELQDHARSRALPAKHPRVVLAGPPNAGKSTLFNALIGREAAIVSPERGTTRDFLTANVVWAGQPLMLVDTAGDEPPGDLIAAESQRHRTEQLERADLVVWCLPAAERLPQRATGPWPKLPASESWPQRPATADHPAPVVIQIATKSDEISEARLSDAIPVSATLGTGLDDLRTTVLQRLAGNAVRSDDWLASTAARSQDALARAAGALSRAAVIAQSEIDQSLLAIELREALDELGTIVGAVYTDDVLDRIFSRFCIGK